MSEITPVLMPMRYVMDPEVEDLLFDGTHLVNGMEVLFGHDILRREPDLEKYHINQLQYNRWMRVSNVTRRRNDIIEFIATFDDGTKTKISVAMSWGWYVKKLSIPEPTPSEMAFEKLVKDLRKTFGPMLDAGVAFSAGPIRKIVGKEAHDYMMNAGFQHDCTKTGCLEGETFGGSNNDVANENPEHIAPTDGL